jgi:DNA-binding GntR family transcriptional regulator
MTVDSDSGRTEQAVAALTAQILSGVLIAGTPLRETAHATALGVSRNTFREAIRVLAARGLVQQARHRGAIVAALTATDVADLYRVRRLLELTAITRTADRPIETFHPLGAAVEQLAAAVGTGDEAKTIEADLAFHRAIVDLHASPRLSRTFANSLDELRLALAMLNARHPVLSGLLEEHRMMYALLLAGDPAGCEALLARHLADSERAVREALPPGSAP